MNFSVCVLNGFKIAFLTTVDPSQFPSKTCKLEKSLFLIFELTLAFKNVLSKLQNVEKIVRATIGHFDLHHARSLLSKNPRRLYHVFEHVQFPGDSQISSLHC